MPGPKKTNRYNSGNGNQADMARKIDDLAFFDDFMNNIAPKLQKMVVDGKGATDIYKIAEAQTAARMLTIAMTAKDPKVAMLAIKEMHDRSLGKAKETINVNNRYEQMTEAELDRLIEQEKNEADSLIN